MYTFPCDDLASSVDKQLVAGPPGLDELPRVPLRARIGWPCEYLSIAVLTLPEVNVKLLGGVWL